MEGLGNSLAQAMRCNARVAFFLFICDCLTVKIRTLFVFREQIVILGRLRRSGQAWKLLLSTRILGEPFGISGEDFSGTSRHMPFRGRR